MATSSADPPDAPTRRRYRSPRRARQAAQTRSAILQAATGLFTTNGWAATGMRDIALEAGVATETLYAHFSSKAALLQNAMDIAVVGDQARVAMAQRPEFAAIAQGSRRDRIAAAALLSAEVNRRTAGFAKVLREAAPTDAAIAEMLSATRERQRADIGDGACQLIGRAPTRRERDGFWAILSPELYLLLVEVSGWSFDEYRSWVAETLERQIPKS